MRSEIRPSTINGLLQKVADRKYKKYVYAINLEFMRGFRDKRVQFDFPVTAIIGPNGGGKTTIMGSSSLIYKSVAPRRFFAKGGKYDDRMADWKVSYELIDRDVHKNAPVSRTASFRQFCWKRDALERDVLVFGVIRTVPATEKKEFQRFAKGDFKVPVSSENSFSAKVVAAASGIIGKDITAFKELTVSKGGKETLLTGSAGDGSSYSEFHFGAGESSVIRMVAQIEASDKNSLILIEEIENGLHPVATIRLVDYLIRVAEEKSSQIIFTTHSDAALIPLPEKAIWVSSGEDIFQGKLSIESLRAITGRIDKRVAIFVEDDFAKMWVEAIFRHANRSLLEELEVHHVGGDGNAVKMVLSHNSNPAVKSDAYCVIDGDSEQVEDEKKRIFRLPGGMPESFIFDEILENWSRLGGKLTVALLQKYSDAESVKKILE